MKKLTFFLLFQAFAFLSATLLPLAPAHGGEAARPKADDAWVTMPAGGKPAYMGIHGGTMPVSLLVSGDGSSLFSFVGRTGNDFLETLRKAKLPLPSFGNSTGQKSIRLPTAHTGLFAGNATASMPVIALEGGVLSRQSWFADLQPFGFSEEPLSIEGEVARPQVQPVARKYRHFYMPDHLQPRRPQ